MRIEVQAIAAGEVDADVLAVPLQAGDGLAGATAELDQSLGGLLAQLREVGELRDDLGSARLVHLSGQVRARRGAPPRGGGAGAVGARGPPTPAPPGAPRA